MRKSDLEPLLVDACDACRLLSVSEPTFRKLNIPRIPIGRAVRYSIEDLREWVRQNREGVPNDERGEENDSDEGER
jgi:hypothetical protein